MATCAKHHRAGVAVGGTGDRKISVLGAEVWVRAQVDPLVVFVGVVSELGWG